MFLQTSDIYEQRDKQAVTNNNRC